MPPQVLHLDEQIRYRIGEVQVLGPDPSTGKSIESEFNPGDVFDWTKLRDLFTKYKDVLPTGASERDIEIRRQASGVVSIRMNFQTCPELPG